MAKTDSKAVANQKTMYDSRPVCEATEQNFTELDRTEPSRDNDTHVAWDYLSL